MSDKPKSDPTNDPEFQKVVRRFLKTPPKPHKPKGDGGERGKKPPAKPEQSKAR